MKIKTFILTFLMMMSCPFLFGQSELTRVRNYGELSEAISNGSPKIQLSNDIDVSESLTIQEGVTIELDLNGWGLIAPEGTYAITNLGALTIKDGFNGNGTIMSRGILNGSSTVATASLTIHSGIYKGIAEKGGAAVYSYGAVTIDGGKFYGKQAAIVCKAGSTMSIDCDATEDQVLIVAEGKKNIAIINEIGESLTIAGKTVIVGTIDERTEYEEGYDQPLASVEESVIFAKAKVGDDVYCENFAKAIEAIKTMSGDVTITLLADAELDITAWETLAIGGSSVNKITINGENGNEDYTLTFNKLNSDWNHVATKNDATLVLKNMKLADSGHNDGPWNRYDHNFACDVELENVVSNKALAFKADAKLTNVTVTDSNDVYAIWIQSNGQSVEIDGLNVDAGRGIKIDEQYVDAVKVTLSVTDATFKTVNKAAIVVKSEAGAAITANNVDITNVAADNKNLVWIDEDGANDYANYYNNVTVEGGSVVMENEDEFVAAITDSEGNINKLYKSLQEAINACTTGDNLITLVDNIKETSVEIDQVEGKNITIDGGETTRFDFSGTIYIHGNARHTGAETLTIKNIDFYNENITAHHDYISCNTTDSHERYAHNVTVENCNFSAPAETEFDVVPMRFRQCYNINVIGGEFTNLHSVMWATGSNGIEFDDITATDCISGISLGTSTGVNIANSTIEAEKFGVRADASVVSKTTIKDCEISAYVPVIARNATANYNIVFDGSNNTMSASNTDGMFCVIDGAKNNYEDGEVSLDAITPAKGHVVVDLQDENLSYDGVYGNYFVAEINGVKYPTVAAAIGAVEAGETIVIVDNAQGDESATTVETDKAFTIDGYAPDYKFPVIKSSADITVKTLNTNNHITTLNNLNMVVDGGNLRINNSVVGGAFEVNAVMSLNNSYLSGTIENNNRINVAGSSNINATSDVKGSGKFYMNAVDMDSRTKMTYANIEFEKGQSPRTSNLKGVTMYAGTFNVPETVTVNVKENSRVGGAAGQSYNVIAGTLDVDNSAVEFGRLEIAQSGKLSVEGNTTVDDQCLNGNELRVIYDLNNAGTLELGDATAAKIATLTLQNNAVVTIKQATVTATNTVLEGEKATLNLNNEAATLVTNEVEGLTTATTVESSKVVYTAGAYKVVNEYFEGTDVAKIGTVGYPTLAEAIAAANDEEIIELIWEDGNDPISMKGSVFGKTVTITGTAKVDWSKGWLYVGRGGEGDGKLIFDEADLTSASANPNSGYGINVSGRKKGTNDTYDGTVEINKSIIDLDYLMNKGAMTLDNSTLTVKNGFSVGGRPGFNGDEQETESGDDATATMTLNNESTVVVDNHNGMGLGYEAIGVMNIDATSKFETKRDFLVTAKGTMNVNGGSVVIAEGMTLTNNGTVYVTGAATLAANVTGDGWFYMNGVTLDADTKLFGAKVGFINGENAIVGSTIKDGWFNVGIGQNSDAEAAAAFATANGITLGNVTVNVSENAIIDGNGATYSGWVGSAYSAAKTQHTYTLNVNNSLAAFGYMHVSKDGIMNIDGRSSDNNRYTQDNANVNFYAGELIINGNVKINNADAWAKYTKVSVDHVGGILDITGDTKYESSIHNGSTTGISLKFWNPGTINIAKGTTFEIDNGTVLVKDAQLNIGIDVVAKGAVTGAGTITLTDKDASFTAPANLDVKSGVETYHVVYSNGAYILHPFSDYVAYIYREAGNAYFESFPQALDAANDGETITVITDGTIYLGSNKSNDLTNKTVTITSGETVETVKVDYNNRSLNVGKDATVIFDAIKLVPANDGNTHNNKFNVKEGGEIKFINNSDATVDFIAVNKGGIVNVENSYVAVQKLFADDATYNAINVTGTSDIKVEAVENSSVVYMENVTLSDATSLAKGAKVVFNTTEENVNTVVKSNLKSVEFNGKTTLNEASLTGTINVKEDAEVDFTNNTYLTSVNGTESVTVAGTLNIDESGAWVRTIAVTGTGELNVTTGRKTIFNQYLGENDLYVRTTLTNNGAINVNKGAIVTIGSASTTGILNGTGALTIADDAKVDASNVAEKNITSQVLLSGDAAKFYAPEGLTNVADVDGLLEPLYEDGYYTLSGMYVAQIGENQYRTIASALEAVQAEGTITLINNTTENVEINKSVKFETIEAGVVITGNVTISNTVTVTVDDNANLTVEGTLTNDANLIVDGTLTTTTLNNQTTGVVTNNGTIAAATFVNEKTFTNNSSLTATTLTNSSSITNYGTLDVLVETTSASTTTYSGSIANTGTINNYGSLKTNEFTSNANVNLYANSSVLVQQTANEVPGSFIVNGDLTLDDNTILNKANITIATSIEGTINGANLVGSKLIAVPGATLKVEGNLNIASLVLQREDVNGFGYVNSTANVNGTLTVGELTNNANLNVKANAKLITTKLTNANSGAITNEGELTANSDGIVNNGTLTNKGTLTAATITNSKTISNATGKSLTVYDALDNKGTINNNGSLTVEGTLTNNSNKNINVKSNSTLIVKGNVKNDGKITVDGILNATSNYNSRTFTNNYDVIINGNGKLNVSTGFTFVNTSGNKGVVKVNGEKAIIYIANNDASATGEFRMNNVNLTSDSKLNNANIVFIEGDVIYGLGKSTISGADLIGSNLKVNTYHTLDVDNALNIKSLELIAYDANTFATVNVNAALTVNDVINNNGELNIKAKTETGDVKNYATGVITVDNATMSELFDQFELYNDGKLIIQNQATVEYDKISNDNVIEVLGSSLIASNLYSSEVNDKVNVSGKSELSAYCSGDGIFNMTDVELNNKTELENANIVFCGTDNQVTSSTLKDSKVTVNEDAVLSLNNATTGDIINNGTINLTGEVHSGKVDNDGTIEMTDHDTKFYTTTDNLVIVPHCIGDVVVDAGDYYYINSTRVAKVGDVEYSSLQAAIDAAGNEGEGTVTIIAENIEENVTVSANTTFVLGTEVSAATINGKLTVAGTATFNCAEIQFTNVDLNAAATMKIEGGNFEVTSIATKGQNVKVNVGETATLAMNVLRVQHSGASFVFNGQVDIAQVIADNSTNPYTIELNAHDAKLVTATTGLNVTTTIDSHRVSYKAEYGWYQLVNTVVAKFNGTEYESLAAALDAVPVGSNNGKIELVWEEGNDPIVMTGVLSGKNATIKAAEGNHSGMVVDWSKGRLYVGRMADNYNGDATLTFDGVEFTSLNDGGNGENGIYVSTRVKNTEHYRGTLNIVNSNVEISSIYTQYVTNINNSTVKFLAATGMNVSGVNASYSPTGSATVSKLFVNNSTIEANNVLVGKLGEGYMLVDVTVDTETLTYTPDADDDSEITVNSTLDVLAGGTLWSAANINGTITNAGTIQLCGGIYTMQPQEGWCAKNYGAFQLPDYTWIVRETGGTQTTEFTEGWHWYSTYIDEIELGDVQDQLSDYASQIKSQFAFTTNFGGGNWSTGGLNTFSPAEMYMINVAKPGTLEFTGDFVDYSNTDIELQKNWNWIGYPVNIEVNVNVALANLQPEVGDQIKGKNGFAVYRGETIGWMPNNLTLVPGNGYMYNSNSDAAKTFVYNAIEAEEETETRATEVKRWNADATQYPSNMTMIAMVSMDGEVVNSNYEVAAFANGELRGSARPVYVEDLDAYMLFLTINGNEVEELTFKYYDVNYGTEYVLNNTINYSNDAIVGSIDEPYMLNLDIMNIDEAATSEISIYPNPTTTDVEINLNATCDTVEVFNALGVKVAEYSNVDSIDALETAGVYVIRITNDGNVQNCRLVVK